MQREEGGGSGGQWFSATFLMNLALEARLMAPRSDLEVGYATLDVRSTTSRCVTEFFITNLKTRALVQNQHTRELISTRTM